MPSSGGKTASAPCFALTVCFSGAFGFSSPARRVPLAGTVSATVPGEAQPAELGQIQVARFTNPAGLQAIGDNFLVETAASGAAEVAPAGENGRGNIRQGMLESSNVNIVEELVEMIEAQRAYEISSKMVSAVDEMLRNANQTL